MKTDWGGRYHPVWLSDSRPVWLEDDSGAWDRELGDEAWLRLFSEKLETSNALSMYSVGHTFYYLMPGDRIFVMGYDRDEIRLVHVPEDR